VDWQRDTAALLALVRLGPAPPERLLADAAAAGGAEALLRDRGGLLARDLLARAERELLAWRGRGIEVMSPSDRRYPPPLATVAAPPPLLFVAGNLAGADRRAVAVVGARRPTERGVAAATATARRLIADGFTVVSGLAAGIDAAVHRAALDAGGRTLAVIGCGLDHAYPPEHADLQRRIAATAAVISQFPPEERPTRRTFPMRNGVMAGLTQATVIVEALATSGTRVQARLALAEGRAVLLLPPVLEQPWARELAERPGVHVVDSPAALSATIRAIASSLASPA
jgi:DNA processing protein